MGYSPWGGKESDTTNTFTVTLGPKVAVVLVAKSCLILATP